MRYINRHLRISPPTNNDAMQEVKLYTTAAERDELESLAEIYSIIVALDAIEKAYLKDTISEEEYTKECSKLLKQYKSFLADEQVAKAFGDLSSFQKEWDVSSLVTSRWLLR